MIEKIILTIIGETLFAGLIYYFFKNMKKEQYKDLISNFTFIFMIILSVCFAIGMLFCK